MRRIEQEKRVVEMMIRLYCRRCEGNREMCAGCADLLRYAHARLDHCHFGDDKPTCRRCTIHCYNPEMRSRISAVMRWAGPRMMLYHPGAAIMHLLRELR